MIEPNKCVGLLSFGILFEVPMLKVGVLATVSWLDCRTRGPLSCISCSVIVIGIYLSAGEASINMHLDQLIEKRLHKQCYAIFSTVMTNYSSWGEDPS